jgi:hypothetical protein
MLLLCEALKTHLEGVVQEFPVPKKGSGRTPPEVITGWLIPKSAGPPGDDHVPCVQIVPIEGSDGPLPEEGGRCSVVMVIQTWAEDHRGWMDCANILQGIRTSLLTLPGRTLANKYALTPKDRKILEWRFFEDQPAPYGIAEMTAHFAIPAPIPPCQWNR